MLNLEFPMAHFIINHSTDNATCTQSTYHKCKCGPLKLFFSSLLWLLFVFSLFLLQYKTIAFEKWIDTIIVLYWYDFHAKIMWRWRFSPSFTWRNANEFNIMHSLVNAYQFCLWTWNCVNERVQPIWRNNMFIVPILRNFLNHSMKCSTNPDIFYLFECQTLFFLSFFLKTYYAL